MKEKPFQGFRSFLKLSDRNQDRFTHAVIGMPVDTATSFRSGARFGPSAIRESSLMLTDGVHPNFPIDITQHAFDLGDVPLTNGNTLKMLEQVENMVGNVLGWGKHPIFMGGDHTVTLGILRAMHAAYGKVAVVHFDAHCDTWSSNFDEPIGHGTWLYNAINEKLVDPVKTISIGIRSPADQEASRFLDKHGGTTFTARYAMRDMAAVISNVRHLVGNTPCYLTFDIDCLDPAFAPGTGTPEVGGLTTMWVLECLEELSNLNWVGMDCVEVSPNYDHSGITSLAAATVIWSYISMNLYRLVAMGSSRSDKGLTPGMEQSINSGV